MKASAFVYPWDVNGDPRAPDRIAALGVTAVTLAAAYHSTRALTPRHPRHRVVTAEYAAVLYPPDDRWRGRALRPHPAGDWAPGDAYGEAAEALAKAGLEVHSWAVLAHNSRLGAEHPQTSVVNAYGDRYPWAPCIAQPATRAFLVDLAAEAAVRPGAAGTELESLGWYGLSHLHAHDKTGGVALDEAGQYLMSLCFCPSCRDGYGARGMDPDDLAVAVRAALEPVWRGGPAGAASEGPSGSVPEGPPGGGGGGGGARRRGGGREAQEGAGGARRRGEHEDAGGAGRRPGSDGDWAAVEASLGVKAAAVTRAWREETARSLQEAAVAAVRAAAPAGFQVLLHADPVTHRTGANPGVDPAHVLAVADGVVVPCTGGPALLTPFAEVRREGAVLAANLTVVSGMGGAPASLAADAARARSHGATELRLYHAGLASDADLEAVRRGISAL